MKRTVSRIALSGLMVTLLLAATVFQGRRSGIVPKVHAQDDEADRGCTNASLNGSYGFYRTGTTSAGPTTAVGFVTYDGNGFGSGPQTIRRNGVTTSDLFTDPPVGGPYEVDPDCAGRLLAPLACWRT